MVGDLHTSCKFENFDYLNVAFISYKLTMPKDQACKEPKT